MNGLPFAATMWRSTPGRISSTRRIGGVLQLATTRKSKAFVRTVSRTKSIAGGSCTAASSNDAAIATPRVAATRFASSDLRTIRSSDQPAMMAHVCITAVGLAEDPLHRQDRRQR